MASHCALQYFPDVVWQLQFGCAHLFPFSVGIAGFPPPNDDDFSDSVVTLKREKPSRRCGSFWAPGIIGSMQTSTQRWNLAGHLYFT
ncbi:MAG TPA: hypothetical protein VGR94_04840 [Candidatus Acidoferrales bacterium]|nr:hypothetical protein [Candidatus Acidoferrales bacterium]